MRNCQFLAFSIESFLAIKLTNVLHFYILLCIMVLFFVFAFMVRLKKSASAVAASKYLSHELYINENGICGKTLKVLDFKLVLFGVYSYSVEGVHEISE